MNIILRRNDLIGDARTQHGIDPARVTLADVHPMLAASIEAAEIVILMLEDCPSLKVLKDDYDKDHQAAAPEACVFPREPEVLHMLLTFGKYGVSLKPKDERASNDNAGD